MDEQKTIVTPNIQFLTEIIDIISKGEVLVPKFQRPFVWRAEDMVALFESIYKGYPIGSVLFWETTQSSITSLSTFGPHKVPKSKKNSITYVLDGHQRLSTLFGALVDASDFASNSRDIDWHWNMYFDLEYEEFLHFPKGDTKNLCIPLNKLIKTIDFLKECKRLTEIAPNSSIYIERAEKVAQAIRNYKITITKIEGGNLDSAVEIFSRLNTKGVSMTNDQMFSALTYKEGEQNFNLADRIDLILEKLVPYKFSEIDRIFIFRAILAATKKDIYNSKIEQLTKDKKLNIPFVVDRCEEAILRAAKFFYEELRVPGDKLLPYNLQFVFLSEFFNNCESPSNEQLEILKRWFWVTSYTGWFAGANSSKIKSGLVDIREFALGEKLTLSEVDFAEKGSSIPERFDFRFARVKIFVLFLLSLDPKDFEYKEPVTNFFDVAGNEGYKALHQIFGNNNSCANRILLGAEKYGYAKRMLINDNITPRVDILLSHGITTDALMQLRAGNDAKFLAQREAYLIGEEQVFMQSLGVAPYDSHLPGQSNQASIFD